MAIIPKGCTVENTFTVPFDFAEMESIFITYAQADKTVIEKNIEQVSVEDKVLYVYLTQEDTLKFNERFKIEIQIRAKYKTGSAIKSEIIVTDTDKVLKTEVI